jgi:hypothetical protein
MSAGESIPDMPSIPFAPGDGLAAGMGMFIFCGVGEAEGVSMPGIFICGDGDGDVFGIFMTGMVRSLSCPADIAKTKSTLSSARDTLTRIYSSLPAGTLVGEQRARPEPAPRSLLHQ